MKGDDNQETSQAEKEQEKVTRKEFLKTIGLGVVGLGLATGGTGLAALDPMAGKRVTTQRFVRHLLQNPDKASEFLLNPLGVAAEFGVDLSDQDVHKIQEGLKKISRRRKDRGETQPTPARPGGGGAVQRRVVPTAWGKSTWMNFTPWSYTARPPKPTGCF